MILQKGYTILIMRILLCRKFIDHLQKQHLYYHRPFIECPGIWQCLYPTPKYHNLVIAVSGVGQQKPFASLITDSISDLQVVDKAQHLPLYWYEEKRESASDTLLMMWKQTNIFVGTE